MGAPPGILRYDPINVAVNRILYQNTITGNAPISPMTRYEKNEILQMELAKAERTIRERHKIQ